MKSSYIVLLHLEILLPLTFAYAILVFHGAKHKSVQEVFDYTGTTVNGSYLVPFL